MKRVFAKATVEKCKLWNKFYETLYMKWLLWTSIYETNIFEIIVYELIHLWIVTLWNQVYGTIGYEPGFMKWLYPGWQAWMVWSWNGLHTHTQGYKHCWLWWCINQECIIHILSFEDEERWNGTAVSVDCTYYHSKFTLLLWCCWVKLFLSLHTDHFPRHLNSSETTLIKIPDVWSLKLMSII